MATDYHAGKKRSSVAEVLDSPMSLDSPLAIRSNPLSTKLSSVLSSSYADSDIRDALGLLDKRGIQNSAETRRQLRLDVQKEVIDSNGEIVREFGHVADVSKIPFYKC